MLYVAHVGVQFVDDESPNEKNNWHFIMQRADIEYRWRISDDFKYEVIAGVFSNPNEALRCAKQMYVSLFFRLIGNNYKLADAGCSIYETRYGNDGVPDIEGYDGDESFFFWGKHYQSDRLGPGVFEVENSLDEFDKLYKSLKCTFTFFHETDLSFRNIDEYVFLYNRKAQECFQTILLAENAIELGMKMTIYCGLLEHLSHSSSKDPDVLLVFDQLEKYVDVSGLSTEKKNSIKNYLKQGRTESASHRCLVLCEKYAKSNYGNVSCKKIIGEAYSIRSAFSHGENCEDRYNSCATSYIKHVVLDVVRGIMIEQERQAELTSQL